MRIALIVLLLAGVAGLTREGEPFDPPLRDKRLSVNTLLREDVFAAILENDNDRLVRAEKNIETLLAQRPDERPVLLVWKAGTIMLRAVRARDAKQEKEFTEKYEQALRLLAEARKAGPKDFGVLAATSGFYTIYADRLPEKLRDKAWAAAYDGYRALWTYQERYVKQLPLHLRGELLGGLAESAQRTGRDKEVTESLDQILKVAPNTAYARAATKWKDDPKAALNTRMTCLSCHTPGRLAARQAALSKEKSD
jgi:hypothetical protein